MEVTPGVRPTRHLHQPAFGIGEKAVVSHIGIGLQISAIRFQKPFRPLAFSCRGVIEYRRRMFAIPDVRPESSPARRTRQLFSELEGRNRHVGLCREYSTGAR